MTPSHYPPFFAAFSRVAPTSAYLLTLPCTACLVDTHAIIGHFAFGATPELEATDLLDRYLSYANEMVCEKNNQRHALALEFLNSTNWQKMEP